jgi:FlaG/FlaF family flagellin (archaellin)
LVSVDFTAASGAFPAGFTPTAGTVTFQPGQTSQSVPFTWDCDSGDNDDRVVTITLSNPSSLLTVSATNGAATLTVRDDDNVRSSGSRGRGSLPDNQKQ